MKIVDMTYQNYGISFDFWGANTSWTQLDLKKRTMEYWRHKLEQLDPSLTVNDVIKSLDNR